MSISSSIFSSQSSSRFLRYISSSRSTIPGSNSSPSYIGLRGFGDREANALLRRTSCRNPTALPSAAFSNFRSVRCSRREDAATIVGNCDRLDRTDASASEPNEALPGLAFARLDGSSAEIRGSRSVSSIRVLEVLAMLLPALLAALRKKRHGCVLLIIPCDTLMLRNISRVDCASVGISTTRSPSSLTYPDPARSDQTVASQLECGQSEFR